MHGPPSAGRVTELIQNPYRHNELYTKTENGVYKSEDKGETWHLMSALRDVEVHSLATFEDKLFVCGNGAYYVDGGGNLERIFGDWCNEVTVSANKLFVTFRGERLGDRKILWADLTSPGFNWQDISPSPSELADLVLPPGDLAFGYAIVVPDVVALGNRILANVVVRVEGSGEHTNGRLYASEDLGGTWARVDLDVPHDVIISKIVEDPDDPEHILLLFQHPVIQGVTYQLSELIRESHDGGRTWTRVTDLTRGSNGLTDVAILGSGYYLLSPYDGFMVRLDGSDGEFVRMPRPEGFEASEFGLDTLLFDFDDPNIVYGKTDEIWALGLLKSEDGMATWRKMDGDIVASSPTIVVAHPSDPSVVLTSGNVIQESYLTRDDGQSWEPFSPVTAGDEVRFDPRDPDRIILIDEMTTLLESRDAGRTFEQIEPAFSSAKVFDFEIARDDPGRIYVSNTGVGISERLASGFWHHLSNSPDYAYDVEIDPDDSGVLYATYSPKIFEDHSSIWRYRETQSEGFGWTELLRVDGSTGMTSLEIDPSNPSTLYAGSTSKAGGAVSRSTDRGDTWANVNEDFFFSTIHSQNQMAVDPADQDFVYAAPWGAGLFTSADGGGAWTELETLPTLSVASVVVHPLNPNVVYASGRAYPVLYRSLDRGRSWESVFDAGPAYSRLFKLTLDPSDPDTLYVSAFRQNAVLGSLFRLRNGEITDITGTIPRAIIDIAVDPTDSQTMYVSLHGESVYKTTDGGVTWHNLDSMPVVGTFDIEIDPSDPAVLYAAAIMGRRCPEELLDPRLFPAVSPEDIGPHGVYKSVDGGSTWQNVNQGVLGGPFRALAIHPSNPDVVYAGGARGVYLTTDGGSTWTAQNEGLDYRSIGALSIGGSKIYAGSRGGGVYVSDIDVDYGLAWTATGGPRPEVFNIRIEVDPTNSDIIYASSYPGGMFKTEDGGATWKDKNFFLPSFEVEDPITQGYYSFAIDPSDHNRLYFTVYGKGVYVSTDGAASQMPLFGDGNEMRGRPVTAVVVDPRDPDTIYVGSQEGVFVTADRGEHWEQINDGLHTSDIRSLRIVENEWLPFSDAFDDCDADGWDLEDGWSVVEDNGNCVLQGVGHRWASAGDEGWEDYTFETRLRLDRGAVHVNVRTGDEGRYLLSFSERGLYLVRHFDGWQQLADLARTEDRYELGRWYDLKIEVSGDRIKVYVDGMLRIDYVDPYPLLNGGIAFESLDDSRVFVDDVHVTIDPGGAVIYAGTGGYGIYKLDRTGRWQNLDRTLGSGWWGAWDRRMYQFSSLLFDPDVPGRVYYAHFPSGFFISEDGGRTWRDSSIGLGNDGMFSLAMHPLDHNVLFAGTYNGVSKSVDGGRTWEMKSEGMPSEQWPFTVAIDDENPNTMYASTKNGQNKGFCERNEFCGVVMKSTDGGESWFKIMNGLPDRGEFYTLLIYPRDHDTLFLSTNRGVYMSRDAGNGWQPMNDGLPRADNQVRDNVADNLALTADNRYLLLGLVDYGVWKADLSALR